QRHARVARGRRYTEGRAAADSRGARDAAASRTPSRAHVAGRDGRGDPAADARLLQPTQGSRRYREPHGSPRARSAESAADTRRRVARHRSMIELSVVIPVHNAEEKLPLLWPELRSVLDADRLDFEVIFVDDGSRDGSAEIVRAMRDRDPRVRLVRLKTNAGETAATDAGFHAARGRLVVTMDADLQNDPRDIPGLLRHLDRWDAVTGWRVNRRDGDSMVRRLSSRIANRVRNWLSDDMIQDSGCTFRAFRRECLRGLVLYRGFHRFMPTLLKMRGYRVVEVPVRHRPRRFGQSKYGVLNRVFVATADLLVVRWMKSRALQYEIAEDLGGDLVRE